MADAENEDGGGKADAENNPSPMMKRNSLMVDDFPDFDPENLEVEDDWRDVFDDEEDDDDSGPLSASTNDAESSNNSNVDRDDKKNGTSDGPANRSSSSNNNNSNNDASGGGARSGDTSMPPPPPLKQTLSTSSMPTTFSSIPGIEELSFNRRPMDHSITRRKKTAGTVDRRESAPPTWHSEAADLPHRKAMVQDM